MTKVSRLRQSKINPKEIILQPLDLKHYKYYLCIGIQLAIVLVNCNFEYEWE